MWVPRRVEIIWATSPKKEFGPPRPIQNRTRHHRPLGHLETRAADIYKIVSRSSTHLFPSHFSFPFSLSDRTLDRRNNHTFLLYLLHHLRSQSILQQPQLTHGSFSLSSSFTTQFLHIAKLTISANFAYFFNLNYLYMIEFSPLDFVSDFGSFC